MLAAAEIDPAVVLDPEGRVSLDQMRTFWAEAVNRSGDPAVGLHAAQHIPHGHYGLIDYLFGYASTVGDGVEMMMRYLPRLNNWIVPTIEIDDDYATLGLDVVWRGIPRTSAEYVFAMLVVRGRAAWRTDWAPALIRFEFPAPRPPEPLGDHARVFGCGIEFGCGAEVTPLRSSLTSLTCEEPDMTSDMTWTTSDDSQGMATVDFVGLQEGKRNVSGALWLPDSPRPDVPLVLFGHGASGDRYQPPIPELAQRFVDELQCPVLSLDGPVHGLRGVAPVGLEAVLVYLKGSEAVADMVDDWHYAIDLALSRDEIGPRQLAYFGLSMGSTFGLPLLAERDDVIVSTLGLLGTTGALPAPMDLMRHTFLDAARRITHPVFYLMQMEDEFVDHNGYLELFDAIASQDKRLHASPGRHAEVPPEELLFAFEFMKSQIERTAIKSATDPPAE